LARPCQKKHRVGGVETADRSARRPPFGNRIADPDGCEGLEGSDAARQDPRLVHFRTARACIPYCRGPDGGIGRAGPLRLECCVRHGDRDWRPRAGPERLLAAGRRL